MNAINTTHNAYLPLTTSGEGSGAGNAQRSVDRATVRAVTASNAAASATGSEAVLLDLSPAAQEYLKGLMQAQAASADSEKTAGTEVAPVGDAAGS